MQNGELAFPGARPPVIRLIHTYPEFNAMYEEAYNIRELDRNTVQYMVEEQQEQLESKVLNP